MTVSPFKSKGRRRLMALGDYIEQQSKDRMWRKFFAMETWFSKWRDVIDKLSLKDGDVVPVNGGCGTAACMLGHAPNVPMLRRLGLRAIYNGDEPVFQLDGRTYDKHYVDDLTIDLFGINEDRMNCIFADTGYAKPLSEVTPMEAVCQLRKVVKQIDGAEGWDF